MQNRDDVAYESYRAYALSMGAEPRSRQDWAAFVDGTFASSRPPRHTRMPAVAFQARTQAETNQTSTAETIKETCASNRKANC
jgi:hypothetical protein